MTIFIYKLPLICIVVGLISYGCITVPIPVLENPPFDSDSIKSIQIGKSTKDDVESLSINPRSGSRRSGKIHIYAKLQRLFFAETLGYGGNALHTVSRVHLLVIQFDDEDVVRTVDICMEGDKISNGIFVKNNGQSDFIQTPRGATPRGIISFLHSGDYYTDYWDNYCILYDYSTDKKAKLFQAPTSKSAIYLFKTNRGRKGDVVLLDLEPTSDCDEGGYLYWVVDPGLHTINGLHFDYEAGQIYFIEFDGKGLRFVDSSTGSKEIEKRTLVVDRLNLLHFY